MRRNWTREEERYLVEQVGVSMVPNIAKRLNRSIYSVEVKMKRMGVYHTRNQVGMTTMGELAKLLGVDRNTVKLWADRDNLPYMKKKTKHEKTFYFIDLVDFWNWANVNRAKIDFSRIDRHALPPEPDWVDPLRKEARLVNYRLWTTKEEQILLSKIQAKKPLEAIAKDMNRSIISIARKYERLKRID